MPALKDTNSRPEKLGGSLWEGNMGRLGHIVIAAVGGLVLATGDLAAQTYPDRPVRIIVPFPPGGLNDTMARLIQPYLENSLGQPVIVHNRPAASGIVGTEVVAKAVPDG